MKTLLTLLALLLLASSAFAGNHTLEWDAPAPPTAAELAGYNEAERAAIVAASVVDQYHVYTLKNGVKTLLGSTPGNVTTYTATVNEPGPVVFAVSAFTPSGESPLSNLVAPFSGTIKLRISVEVTVP